LQNRIQKALAFKEEALRLVAGMAIAALVLTACGGGDSDDDAAGGASAPSDQPTATTPAGTDSTGSAPGAATGATGSVPGGPTGVTGAGVPSPGGSLPSADIDVCALLTKAEAESALGFPVLDPAVVDDPPFATCSLNNPDFPALHRVRVAILVATNNDQARAIFDSSQGPGAEEIPGLGDVAAWYDLTAALEFVTARYDVTISVPPLEGKDTKQIATDLAHLVAQRLQ
jgi:hypothetical protein